MVSVEIDIFPRASLPILLAAAKAGNPCAVARLAALERMFTGEGCCLLCSGKANAAAMLIFVTKPDHVEAHRICRVCIDAPYPEPLSDAISWRLACMAIAGSRLQPMPLAAH
jgi:hypothetical protein